MEFKFTLTDIQHIKELSFSVDLSENQLTCIVGKNSVGKTTLIRTIANLKSADTFKKTASPYIFCDKSHVLYEINGEEYDFTFNPKLSVLDSKSIISEDVKDLMAVELPIPYGERFSHFQTLGEYDTEFRTSIPLGNYNQPTELIDFLTSIYGSNRFENLKEISIKGTKYYFILKDDDFYVREDYLSSGEYFVIHLYKLIQEKGN